MKKNPTLAKTVSWLVVSGILITCTGWFESGSFMVGLMTAVWASIIKTPIYSVHEALWGRLIFKKEKPTPPDINLFENVPTPVANVTV